jgi:hypothetical protein
MASGDVLSNDVIERRVGTTIRTSDTASVTTTETVSDSVTAFLTSGRTYAVVWVTGVTSDVAADSIFCRIREDSISGNILSVNRVHSPLTNGAGSRWPSYNYVEFTAASTGNKTFVSTFVRASGTGNVKVTAGTTTQTYLFVEYSRG